MAIISSCSFPQAIFFPSHSPTHFHTNPQLLYISNTPTPPLSSLFLSKTSHFLSKPRLQHLPFLAYRSQFFSTLNPYLFAHQPHFPTESLTNIPLSSTSTEALHDDFINLLHLSVRSGDTKLVKAVHTSILKFEEDTHLGNVLIVAYLKLGLVVYARRVFVGLSCPSVVSYTTIISGFAKSNREYEAMELFSRMRSSGIQPNEFSFVAILTACIRVLELGLGFQVHALVIKMGYVGCVFVANALMGLYARCGYVDLVVELFAEMPKRDIVSWNTLISANVRGLMHVKALDMFRHMQLTDGFRVDKFTLSTLIAACTGSLAWMEGREIHAHALKIGFGSNLSVNNALIGFYTEHRSVKYVVALFERMPIKDVITWTQMITAYMEFGLVDMAVEIFDKMPARNCVSYNALLAGMCQNGQGLRALKLFVRMVEEGIELTDSTLSSVVSACGLLMEVKTSEQIHGFIIKFGFGSNACIEAALLDMCTKCGRMDDAQEMYDQWPVDQNGTVIWTSMICGYAREGQPEEAIYLFHLKHSEGIVVADEVVLTAVLGVCGTLGFHEMGGQIHCYALKSGFTSDLGVGNALISMYAKCGSMDGAIRVFKIMSIYDVVSVNSLIAGHLVHRQGDEALAVWSKMEDACIKPDIVTFILIISAYRHTKTNLVNDCRRLFFSMKTIHQIEPTQEHYASFISVLGYWGLLEEAEKIIIKMPFEADAFVWRALLDSCRIRSNTTLGKRTAKRILAMEPQDPSTYVLVSNLYSASGRWQCAESVREEMREKGFRKHPGRSWIIHQNKVHSFYGRDKSHSQSKDIYSGLKILILECLKVGYVPDTSFVLQEVEEHQKENFLFYHSAKLAVTYGLLMTKPGKPIRVVKNIVLCGDCHTFFKYVSIVTRREIFIRDASGYHCFSNGLCLCKDYW